MQTVGGKRVWVTDLVNEELSPVHLAIIAALSKSEGNVG